MLAALLLAALALPSEAAQHAAQRVGQGAAQATGQGTAQARGQGTREGTGEQAGSPPAQLSGPRVAAARGRAPPAQGHAVAGHAAAGHAAGARGDGPGRGAHAARGATAPEAGPVGDDPPGGDDALGGDDAPGGVDPAVGRLNHAGYRARRHCTAALVAPREAVTARHCVEGLEVAGLHLLLGYALGAYGEHRRVAHVVASRTEDVARLCLDAPAKARPLDAARAAPGAGEAQARGYPASRPHRQETRRCGLVPVEGRALARLDCPLEPGFSGAPVSVGGAVVGVASTSGDAGSVIALLSALPEGGCAPGPEP